MIKLRTGYGVGDILLATGVVKALQRQRPQKIIIETHYPELFFHNPDVFYVLEEGKITSAIQRIWGHAGVWRIGSICLKVYPHFDHKFNYPFPCRGEHLIDAMATSAGVSLLPQERRPFLYLTEQEKTDQSWAKGWIAVQSSSTTYWTPNKNWVPGRMQQVVDTFCEKGFSFVQLGSSEDEPLEGVTDLRGKITLRQGAAILANTKMFIGLEGGLVHTARAVGAKSVVIYTGYTLPIETGYPENVNLRSPYAGESCWSRELCEHCKQSAMDVSVEDVISSAESLLNRE